MFQLNKYLKPWESQFFILKKNNLQNTNVAQIGKTFDYIEIIPKLELIIAYAVAATGQLYRLHCSF